MDECGSVDVSSVRFTIRVSKFTTPERLEWLPDAASFVLQIRDEDDTVTERRHGHTCLEHAFLLLDRLETRESGWLLWGTGPTDIHFHGDTVRLFGNPEVTGTVDEVRATTEDLITQMFDWMRCHDTGTRSVAANIANGRFAPWAIDPVDVHDRLLD